MAQKTDTNPPLHQTVLDLLNDNATDAEERLVALVEALNNVAKLDKRNDFAEPIICEKSIIAKNPSSTNNISMDTTTDGIGLLSSNIDGTIYKQVALFSSGEVSLRYQGDFENTGLSTTFNGGRLIGTWSGVTRSSAELKDDKTPYVLSDHERLNDEGDAVSDLMTRHEVMLLIDKLKSDNGLE